jgi:DNA-binding NtrC family response regulator
MLVFTLRSGTQNASNSPGHLMRSMGMKNSVLIVDDEAQAREGLAKILSSHGFLIATASNSAEAAQLMAVSPAETVLLDLDLPLVPGDSVAAFLNIRYPKTRIIFISGQYDMVNPERFGEDTLYLHKPIDVDALVKVLRCDRPTSAHPQPAMD